MTQNQRTLVLAAVLALPLAALLIWLQATRVAGHDHDHPHEHPHADGSVHQTGPVQSRAGDNMWNQGAEPEDWWAEVRRQHGHVGPWNVVGWRIGQAAMRELDSQWGRHDLQIICHVPPQTPFTCMIDGLAVGTGNSMGRLDLRMAEVLHYHQSAVSVRRKDETGPVLVFTPRRDYLDHITTEPPEKMEELSRACVEMPEDQLFTLQRINADSRPR